jgi:hypothetical protein
VPHGQRNDLKHSHGRAQEFLLGTGGKRTKNYQQLRETKGRRKMDDGSRVMPLTRLTKIRACCGVSTFPAVHTVKSDVSVTIPFFRTVDIPKLRK